jgi:pyrroline-5-carboxylate reductase
LTEIVLGALAEGIHVTDQKYFGMATTLGGGDPAYVFFVEAPVHADVRIGLPRDMAQELVIQTILGSTRTVEKTAKHPADLGNMVTSPGGATTEALLQLKKGRFRSPLLEAVAAAYEEDERL